MNVGGNPEPRPPLLLHVEQTCPECGVLVPMTLEAGPSVQRGKYVSISLTPIDLTDCYAHQWTHEEEDQ